MSLPHTPGEVHPGDTPLTQMLVSMSGASGGDHGTEPPGASEASVTAGHEPDKFAVSGVLLVPVAVAITLVMTYILVTVLFGVLDHGRASATPGGDTKVEAENAAPINQRFAVISSTDPKGMAETKTGQVIAPAVAQPRLEYLRLQGDPQDPPFVRSKRPLTEGNSPEYRPEDLRPEQFVDPTTKTRLLAEYGYVGDKKELARVPINDYIHYAVGHKKFASRKDAPRLPVISDDRAKISNGGRGGQVPPTLSAAKTAAPRTDDHHDHDHDKKGDKEPAGPPMKKETGDGKNSKAGQ